MTNADTHIVPLTATKPPLTANQRLHWAAKARLVRDLRFEARILARKAELPRGCARATITLHYRPRDNRRRDRHNLWPTVKAAVDGLVDYGLVPDDDAAHVSTPEPVIHQASREPGARLWLEIVV